MAENEDLPSFKRNLRSMVNSIANGESVVINVENFFSWTDWVNVPKPAVTGAHIDYIRITASIDMSRALLKRRSLHAATFEKEKTMAIKFLEWALQICAVNLSRALDTDKLMHLILDPEQPLYAVLDTVVPPGVREAAARKGEGAAFAEALARTAAASAPVAPITAAASGAQPAAAAPVIDSDPDFAEKLQPGVVIDLLRPAPPSDDAAAATTAAGPAAAVWRNVRVLDVSPTATELQFEDTESHAIEWLSTEGCAMAASGSFTGANAAAGGSGLGAAFPLAVSPASGVSFAADDASLCALCSPREVTARLEAKIGWLLDFQDRMGRWRQGCVVDERPADEASAVRLAALGRLAEAAATAAAAATSTSAAPSAASAAAAAPSTTPRSVAPMWAGADAVIRKAGAKLSSYVRVIPLVNGTASSIACTALAEVEWLPRWSHRLARLNWMSGGRGAEIATAAAAAAAVLTSAASASAASAPSAAAIAAARDFAPPFECDFERAIPVLDDACYAAMRAKDYVTYNRHCSYNILSLTHSIFPVQKSPTVLRLLEYFLYNCLASNEAQPPFQLVRRISFKNIAIPPPPAPPPPNAKFNVSFTWITDTLTMFGKLADVFTPRNMPAALVIPGAPIEGAARTLLFPIAQAAVNYTLRVSDADVRGIAGKEQIDAFVLGMRRILCRVSDTIEDAGKFAELTQLKLALACIKSPQLMKQRDGMKVLSDLVTLTRNKVLTPSGVLRTGVDPHAEDDGSCSGGGGSTTYCRVPLASSYVPSVLVSDAEAVLTQVFVTRPHRELIRLSAELVRLLCYEPPSSGEAASVLPTALWTALCASDENDVEACVGLVGEVRTDLPPRVWSFILDRQLLQQQQQLQQQHSPGAQAAAAAAAATAGASTAGGSAPSGGASGGGPGAVNAAQLRLVRLFSSAAQSMQPGAAAAAAAAAAASASITDTPASGPLSDDVHRFQVVFRAVAALFTLAIGFLPTAQSDAACVAPAVSDAAQDALLSALALPALHPLRQPYLHAAVRLVERHACVPRALAIMRGILATFPATSTPVCEQPRQSSLGDGSSSSSSCSGGSALLIDIDESAAAAAPLTIAEAIAQLQGSHALTEVLLSHLHALCRTITRIAALMGIETWAVITGTAPTSTSVAGIITPSSPSSSAAARATATAAASSSPSAAVRDLSAFSPETLEAVNVLDEATAVCGLEGEETIQSPVTAAARAFPVADMRVFGDALTALLGGPLGDGLSPSDATSAAFNAGLRATLDALAFVLLCSDIILPTEGTCALWDDCVLRAVTPCQRATALAWFTQALGALARAEGPSCASPAVTEKFAQLRLQRGRGDAAAAAAAAATATAAAASNGSGAHRDTLAPGPSVNSLVGCPHPRPTRSGRSTVGIIFDGDAAQTLFRSRLSTMEYASSVCTDTLAFGTWKAFFLYTNGAAGTIQHGGGNLATLGAGGPSLSQLSTTASASAAPSLSSGPQQPQGPATGVAAAHTPRIVFEELLPADVVALVAANAAATAASAFAAVSATAAAETSPAAHTTLTSAAAAAVGQGGFGGAAAASSPSSTSALRPHESFRTSSGSSNVTGAGGLLVLSADLEGLDILWQITMHGPNADVASACVSLLTSLQVRLAPSLQARAGELRRAHVSRCMTSVRHAYMDRGGGGEAAQTQSREALALQSTWPWDGSSGNSSSVSSSASASSSSSSSLSVPSTPRSSSSSSMISAGTPGSAGRGSSTTSNAAAAVGCASDRLIERSVALLHSLLDEVEDEGFSVESGLISAFERGAALLRALSSNAMNATTVAALSRSKTDLESLLTAARAAISASGGHALDYGDALDGKLGGRSSTGDDADTSIVLKVSIGLLSSSGSGNNSGSSGNSSGSSSAAAGGTSTCIVLGPAPPPTAGAGVGAMHCATATTVVEKDSDAVMDTTAVADAIAAGNPAGAAAPTGNADTAALAAAAAASITSPSRTFGSTSTLNGSRLASDLRLKFNLRERGADVVHAIEALTGLPHAAFRVLVPLAAFAQSGSIARTGPVASFFEQPTSTSTSRPSAVSSTTSTSDAPSAPPFLSSSRELTGLLLGHTLAELGMRDGGALNVIWRGSEHRDRDSGTSSIIGACSAEHRDRAFAAPSAAADVDDVMQQERQQQQSPDSDDLLHSSTVTHLSLTHRMLPTSDDDEEVDGGLVSSSSTSSDDSTGARCIVPPRQTSSSSSSSSSSKRVSGGPVQLAPGDHIAAVVQELRDGLAQYASCTAVMLAGDVRHISLLHAVVNAAHAPLTSSSTSGSSSSTNSTVTMNNGVPLSAATASRAWKLLCRLPTCPAYSNALHALLLSGGSSGASHAQVSDGDHTMTSTPSNSSTTSSSTSPWDALLPLHDAVSSSQLLYGVLSVRTLLDAHAFPGGGGATSAEDAGCSSGGFEEPTRAALARIQNRSEKAALVESIAQTARARRCAFLNACGLTSTSVHHHAASSASLHHAASSTTYGTAPLQPAAAAPAWSDAAAAAHLCTLQCALLSGSDSGGMAHILCRVLPVVLPQVARSQVEVGGRVRCTSLSAVRLATAELLLRLSRRALVGACDAMSSTLPAADTLQTKSSSNSSGNSGKNSGGSSCRNSIVLAFCSSGEHPVPSYLLPAYVSLLNWLDGEDGHVAALAVDLLQSSHALLADGLAAALTNECEPAAALLESCVTGCVLLWITLSVHSPALWSLSASLMSGGAAAPSDFNLSTPGTTPSHAGHHRHGHHAQHRHHYRQVKATPNFNLHSGVHAASPPNFNLGQARLVSSLAHRLLLAPIGVGAVGAPSGVDLSALPSALPESAFGLLEERHMCARLRAFGGTALYLLSAALPASRDLLLTELAAMRPRHCWWWEPATSSSTLPRVSAGPSPHSPTSISSTPMRDLPRLGPMTQLPHMRRVPAVTTGNALSARSSSSGDVSSLMALEGPEVEVVSASCDRNPALARSSGIYFVLLEVLLRESLIGLTAATMSVTSTSSSTSATSTSMCLPPHLQALLAELVQDVVIAPVVENARASRATGVAASDALSRSNTDPTLTVASYPIPDLAALAAACGRSAATGSRSVDLITLPDVSSSPAPVVEVWTTWAAALRSDPCTVTRQLLTAAALRCHAVVAPRYGVAPLNPQFLSGMLLGTGTGGGAATSDGFALAQSILAAPGVLPVGTTAAALLGPAAAATPDSTQAQMAQAISMSLSSFIGGSTTPAAAAIPVETAAAATMIAAAVEGGGGAPEADAAAAALASSGGITSPTTAALLDAAAAAAVAATPVGGPTPPTPPLPFSSSSSVPGTATPPPLLEVEVGVPLLDPAADGILVGCLRLVTALMEADPTALHRARTQALSSASTQVEVGAGPWSSGSSSGPDLTETLYRDYVSPCGGPSPYRAYPADSSGMGLHTGSSSASAADAAAPLLQYVEVDAAALPKAKSVQARRAALRLLSALTRTSSAAACTLSSLIITEGVELYDRPFASGGIAVAFPATAPGGPGFAGPAALAQRVQTATLSSREGISSSGYVGLRNLGCTCYMNALMQQFYMCEPLRYGLLSVPTGETLPDAARSESVVYEVQRMFAFLELSDRRAYDPWRWMNAYKDSDGKPSNPGLQQDAQEYLVTLCDRIEWGLRGSTRASLINQTVGIVRKEVKVCTGGCGTVRTVTEPAVCLTVEVTRGTTLAASLEATFLSWEDIVDYECDACKRRTTLRKRDTLETLPHTLIVHLKRFDMDYETGATTKLNNRFEFPLELDLCPYSFDVFDAAQTPRTSTSSKRSPEYFNYDLVGVVVHTGSIESGHYYSFIKERGMRAGGRAMEAGSSSSSGGAVPSTGPSAVTAAPAAMNGASAAATAAPPRGPIADPYWTSGRWLEFNDSVVQEFEPSRIPAECYGGTLPNSDVPVAKNAYMLVYERKRPQPVDVDAAHAPHAVAAAAAAAAAAGAGGQLQLGSIHPGAAQLGSTRGLLSAMSTEETIGPQLPPAFDRGDAVHAAPSSSASSSAAAGLSGGGGGLLPTSSVNKRQRTDGPDSEATIAHSRASPPQSALLQLAAPLALRTAPAPSKFNLHPHEWSPRDRLGRGPLPVSLVTDVLQDNATFLKCCSLTDADFAGALHLFTDTLSRMPRVLFAAAAAEEGEGGAAAAEAAFAQNCARLSASYTPHRAAAAAAGNASAPAPLVDAHTLFDYVDLAAATRNPNPASAAAADAMSETGTDIDMESTTPTHAQGAGGAALLRAHAHGAALVAHGASHLHELTRALLLYAVCPLSYAPFAALATPHFMHALARVIGMAGDEKPAVGLLQLVTISGSVGPPPVLQPPTATPAGVAPAVVAAAAATAQAAHAAATAKHAALAAQTALAGPLLCARGSDVEVLKDVLLRSPAPSIRAAASRLLLTAAMKVMLELPDALRRPLIHGTEAQLSSVSRALPASLFDVDMHPSAVLLRSFLARLWNQAFFWETLQPLWRHHDAFLSLLYDLARGGFGCGLPLLRSAGSALSIRELCLLACAQRTAALVPGAGALAGLVEASRAAVAPSLASDAYVEGLRDWGNGVVITTPSVSALFAAASADATAYCRRIAAAPEPGRNAFAEGPLPGWPSSDDDLTGGGGGAVFEVREEAALIAHDGLCALAHRMREHMIICADVIALVADLVLGRASPFNNPKRVIGGVKSAICLGRAYDLLSLLYRSTAPIDYALIPESNNSDDSAVPMRPTAVVWGPVQSAPRSPLLAAAAAATAAAPPGGRSSGAAAVASPLSSARGPAPAPARSGAISTRSGSTGGGSPGDCARSIDDVIRVDDAAYILVARWQRFLCPLLERYDFVPVTPHVPPALRRLLLPSTPLDQALQARCVPHLWRIVHERALAVDALRRNPGATVQYQGENFRSIDRLPVYAGLNEDAFVEAAPRYTCSIDHVEESVLSALLAGANAAAPSPPVTALLSKVDPTLFDLRPGTGLLLTDPAWEGKPAGYWPNFAKNLDFIRAAVGLGITDRAESQIHPWGALGPNIEAAITMAVHASTYSHRNTSVLLLTLGRAIEFDGRGSNKMPGPKSVSDSDEDDDDWPEASDLLPALCVSEALLLIQDAFTTNRGQALGKSIWAGFVVYFKSRHGKEYALECLNAVLRAIILTPSVRSVLNSFSNADNVYIIEDFLRTLECDTHGGWGRAPQWLARTLDLSGTRPECGWGGPSAAAPPGSSPPGSHSSSGGTPRISLPELGSSNNSSGGAASATQAALMARLAGPVTQISLQEELVILRTARGGLAQNLVTTSLRTTLVLNRMAAMLKMFAWPPMRGRAAWEALRAEKAAAAAAAAGAQAGAARPA